MDDIKERIEVLVNQEEKFYRCADYFACESNDGQQQRQQHNQHPRHQHKQHHQQQVGSADVAITSPLHVVLQCANLVTDGFLSPDYTTTTTTTTVDASSTSSSSSSSFESSPCRESLVQFLANQKNAKRPEPESPRSSMYISGNLSGNSNSQSGSSSDRSCLSSITTWRLQMFQWATMVMDSYGMPRDVVAIAFDILDRYVASEVFADIENDSDTSVDDVSINRDDFQLFSMVALYIASKISQTYHQKLSIETLLEMSRGYYSRDDITITERDMLSTIQWRVNPPTTMEYCRLYFELFAHVNNNKNKTQNGQKDNDQLLLFELEANSAYLAELALSDCYFVDKSNATVGLAVVLLAIRRLDLSQEEQFAHCLDNYLFNSTDSFNVLNNDFESIYCYLENISS